MEVEVVVPGHGPVSDKSAVPRKRNTWNTSRMKWASASRRACPRRTPRTTSPAAMTSPNRPSPSWDSPERIMTNTHVIYRHLQGKAGHLKAAEKLNILRKQALLAHEWRRTFA